MASLHKVSFTGVTGPIAFQADGNLKVDKGAVQISEVDNGVDHSCYQRRLITFKN